MISMILSGFGWSWAGLREVASWASLGASEGALGASWANFKAIGNFVSRDALSTRAEGGIVSYDNHNSDLLNGDNLVFTVHRSLDRSMSHLRLCIFLGWGLKHGVESICFIYQPTSSLKSTIYMFG